MPAVANISCNNNIYSSIINTMLYIVIIFLVCFVCKNIHIIIIQYQLNIMMFKDAVQERK